MDGYSIIPVGEENDTCSVCGANYWEETERMRKTWIGCDGRCGQWFHYKCADFKRMPSRKVPFTCSSCT